MLSQIPRPSQLSPCIYVYTFTSIFTELQKENIFSLIFPWNFYFYFLVILNMTNKWNVHPVTYQKLYLSTPWVQNIKGSCKFISLALLKKMKFFLCVATVQGLAGSWYSRRWKNTHGAFGMSGMPLFTGGRAMRAASCVFPCMSL